MGRCGQEQDIGERQHRVVRQNGPKLTTNRSHKTTRGHKTSRAARLPEYHADTMNSQAGSPHIASQSAGKSRLPWIAVALLTLGMVVAMRFFEGRLWFCECGSIRVWIGDVWTSHCSQHLFDPYSVTHFSHGLFFFWIFMGISVWLTRHGGKGISIAWMFAGSLALAAGWEVLENSSFIINRYRTATMSLDYLGDSVVNSLGDLLCCAAGFWVAKKIGLWKTVAVFVASEIVLLFLIRDGLVLSTFMLIWPIDWIKQWQVAAKSAI